MLFTPDQFIAHAVGDYVLQSDWMANEKTKKSVAALAHVGTYTLPFLFLTQNWRALLIIAGSHFVIDRWRLARYVCWLKNFLNPHAMSKPWEENGGPALKEKDGQYLRQAAWNYPWSECSGTGYHQDRPAWMAVWLMIITDNLMHVGINALALRYFP